MNSVGYVLRRLREEGKLSQGNKGTKQCHGKAVACLPGMDVYCDETDEDEDGEISCIENVQTSFLPFQKNKSSVTIVFAAGRCPTRGRGRQGKPGQPQPGAERRQGGTAGLPRAAARERPRAARRHPGR